MNLAPRPFGQAAPTLSLLLFFVIDFVVVIVVRLFSCVVLTLLSFLLSLSLFFRLFVLFCFVFYHVQDSK